MTIQLLPRQRRGRECLLWISKRPFMATITTNVGYYNKGRSNYATSSHQQQIASSVTKEPTHAFDSQIMRIFSVLHKKNPSRPPVSLPHLLRQYDNTDGRVIKATLPNESSPGQSRRPPLAHSNMQGNGLALVAHIVSDGQEDDIALASGFFIQPSGMRPVLVSCSHTLEQIRYSPLLRSPSSRSCTIIMSSTTNYNVAEEVIASLPRSDLTLFSISPTLPSPHRTLPVSMYPVPKGTLIAMHSFPQHETALSEPTPSEWVSGQVHGYRDFSGREAEPGTYDALSHLLFTPPPTPGMSGSPIVDEASGAVVGMITGSRMLNRVEGLKGWATPAEPLFELFDLI